jgi:nucleoside-diphosphate-sugar epimerase
VPLISPVLPDPGVPFQLVHHDDVAAALCAAVLGRGRPGVYNLAGQGSVSIGQLSAELGWHSLPVPRIAVEAAGELVSRMPLMPARAAWIHAFRTPVLVDSTKAHRELGWRPAHDSVETLRETVRSARLAGLV